MKISARDIGFAIEKEARNFLEQQGLIFKECNFNCLLGEIDLIMEDNEFTVFVEVRFRNDKLYGGALASISRSKQTKIIRAAKYYLLEKNLYDKTFCRFDIIAAENRNGELIIEWFRNAFNENFL